MFYIINPLNELDIVEVKETCWSLKHVYGEIPRKEADKN